MIHRYLTMIYTQLRCVKKENGHLNEYGSKDDTRVVLYV